MYKIKTKETFQNKSLVLVWSLYKVTCAELFLVSGPNLDYSYLTYHVCGFLSTQHQPDDISTAEKEELGKLSGVAEY